MALIDGRKHRSPAMKLGSHHAMGSFTLADLIGLDVCLSIMNSLFDEK